MTAGRRPRHVFVGLEAGARDVAIMINDLSRARQPVSLDSKADPRELFESGNRIRPA
jgi:hypothetical protein